MGQINYSIRHLISDIHPCSSSSLHNFGPNHKELAKWVQVTYPFLILNIPLLVVPDCTFFL